jgi:hypothetical protein
VNGIVVVHVTLGVDRRGAAGRHGTHEDEHAVVQDGLALLVVVDRFGTLVDESHGGELFELLDDGGLDFERDRLLFVECAREDDPVELIDLAARYMFGRIGGRERSDERGIDVGLTVRRARSLGAARCGGERDREEGSEPSQRRLRSVAGTVATRPVAPNNSSSATF